MSESRIQYNPERFNDEDDLFNKGESPETRIVFTDRDREDALKPFENAIQVGRKKIME